MKAVDYAHFLEHTLRLRWSKMHRAPLTMNVQLTYRCPNHCLYCSYDRARPDRLTLDILCDVARDAWAIGGRRVNLTGGEPLLRDDFPEIVSMLKRTGYFVSVATSGYAAARYAGSLAACDRVMLSFDGPDDVRAQLRGERSMRESREAVDVFRAHGIGFWTTTVLSRPSLDHIDWIVEHARRNGSMANFVLLHTQHNEGVRFHPSPDEVGDLMPEPQDLRRALRHIIDLKKNGAPVGSSMAYLEELAAWRDYRHVTSADHSPRYRCVAARASCELTADGTLYGCGWHRATHDGISIFDHGFASAFASLPLLDGCNSCASSCWLESNLIFNLHPGTVWNWMKAL